MRSALKLTPRMSQLLEVKTLRESFKISRNLEGSQEALKSAVSLSKLVQPCTDLDLSIEGAAKYDMANVLWDHGEMTISIRMLQQLNEQGDLQKQALVVSRAEVLASLVYMSFTSFSAQILTDNLVIGTPRRRGTPGET